MINSNDLTYKPLYYAYDDGEREYIVTYGNSVTIANEFVAHWICEKHNLPTAKTHLVSENGIIPSDYALAIECVEGLRRIKEPPLSQNLQDEFIGHLTVGYLLGSLDTMRFYTDSEHVYAFNYRNAFHFSGSSFSGNDDKELKKENIKSYKKYLHSVDFDISELAESWCIPIATLKEGIITYSMKLSTITNKDLTSLEHELKSLFPKPVISMYKKAIIDLQLYIEKFIFSVIQLMLYIIIFSVTN